MRQIIPFILFILLFGAGINAQPWNPETIDTETAEYTSPELKSVFTALNYSEIVTVNLTTDVDLLIEQKKKDTYQEASINFKTVDGQHAQQIVKIKARGKSRRRICDFPPIKIKFKKDNLEAAGYHREFNEYKLVTHCSDDEEAELNILKEYLAYKMYNELTSHSFKVQLVKINYIDTKSASVRYTKFGFLLEDNEEMSSRLNGKMTKTYNISTNELDAQQYNLMAMFQYMIGNTDWNISVMHNIKIVQSDSQTAPVLVPYDFDFAGVVNTNYARPNPDLPQTSVRDRVYQGLCLEDTELSQILDVMEDKEDEILALVKNFDHLPKKQRRDIQKYLKEFFYLIDQPDLLKTELHWNCPVEN